MRRLRKCLGHTHHSVPGPGQSGQQDVPVLVRRCLQRIQIRYQAPEPQRATMLIFLCPEGLPAKRDGQQQEQQAPVLLHECVRRLELKASCAMTT